MKIMEQIVIQVNNKKKAQALYEFLTALDFVESVRTGTVEVERAVSTSRQESIDFFSFAGLWQDRDMSLESLRQKAWPRQ